MPFFKIKGDVWNIRRYFYKDQYMMKRKRFLKLSELRCKPQWIAWQIIQKENGLVSSSLSKGELIPNDYVPNRENSMPYAPHKHFASPKVNIE